MRLSTPIARARTNERYKCRLVKEVFSEAVISAAAPNSYKWTWDNSR